MSKPPAKRRHVRVGRQNDGRSTHPLYWLYWGMRHRCEDRNAKAYPRYGGAGIYVCEEWRTSFEQFCTDVGPRPSDRHSLDRYPDRHGPYRPGNVRWATPEEQGANKDSVKLYEHDGRSLPLRAWQRELPIAWMTLRKYVLEKGMTIGDVVAMGKPKRGRPFKKAAP